MVPAGESIAQIEMLDQHESHSRIAGQGFQEFRECFQTSGRSSHSDNWKPIRPWLGDLYWCFCCWSSEACGGVEAFSDRFLVDRSGVTYFPADMAGRFRFADWASHGFPGHTSSNTLPLPAGEQKGFPHYPAVSNPGQARRQTLEGIAVSQPRPTPPADPAELRLHEAVGRGFSLAAKSILAKAILEMG